MSRLIRETQNAKQRDRYHAVELAITGQATQPIMQMLARSRGFAQRWCYTYRDDGLDAVAAACGASDRVQVGRCVRRGGAPRDAPLTGASSALIAPSVNTKLMSDHLRMIAEEAGAGVHVVLALDGAGWQASWNKLTPGRLQTITATAGLTHES